MTIEKHSSGASNVETPAARVRQMQESASIAIAELTRRLTAQGMSIIDLSVGEPDFDTPAYIKAAAVEALFSGKTKYTNVDGTSDLKLAIIAKLNRDNGLVYSDQEIIVSGGAKQAIFNAMLAVLEPTDEVVIPTPFWVSYPEIVGLTGATPVYAPTTLDSGFKLTAAVLRRHLSHRTRLVILNSPNNPTGAVYTRDELQQIGDVIAEHSRVLVLSDDIYEHICWGEHGFCNLSMARPDLHSRTIVVNGVSKAYAMTGWRIGYAAGQKWIIDAMKKIQGQSTTCANSVAQYAASVALNGGIHCTKEMVRTFQRRSQTVVAALNEIEGVECHPAAGTFYAFANVSDLMRMLKMRTDRDLVRHWLMNARVALVPGSAYGAPGYVRVSYAASDEQLREAMLRLSHASRQC